MVRLVAAGRLIIKLLSEQNDSRRSLFPSSVTGTQEPIFALLGVGSDCLGKPPPPPLPPPLHFKLFLAVIDNT